MSNTTLEMPLANPNVPAASNTMSKLSDVLFTGNSDITVHETTKEITFKKNRNHTIYPFLYDANTGITKGYGYYDPFDAHNPKYRLYISYTKNNLDWLGLPKHGQSAQSAFRWFSGIQPTRRHCDRAPPLLTEGRSTRKSSPVTNPIFLLL